MRLIDQPLPGLEHVTEARQIERDFAGHGASGSVRPVVGYPQGPRCPVGT
jgi:hypothetical protein